MLRLMTFGGLTLQHDGGLHTGPASQRRRLAVLAVIAAAGRRGVSRDRLVDLLWPDRAPDAGRHSLYQTLHVLRRALGGDDLLLGTTTLQLNPAMMSSDVADFEEAVSRGALERAVGLYAGPFLDGFRLEDARDFDQWAEGERLRHAREVASALEALAGEAATRGDFGAAVRWWRRLASAEPVSARAALGLIETDRKSVV